MKTKITVNQIEARLRVWKIRQDALMEQIDALIKLTGCDLDSAFMRPVIDISEAHTKAVGEIVGDDNLWMNYFKYDCEMGKNPKKVTFQDGREINIKTLRNLAQVIAKD